MMNILAFKQARIAAMEDEYVGASLSNIDRGPMTIPMQYVAAV